MATKKLSARDRAADLRLRREFHLTLDQYNLIFKYQGGKCYICKQPSKGKRLAVDHDHKSGLVRGLLCMKCNRALGKFRDDTQLVVNAADYVTNPPATAALGSSHFTAPHAVGTKVRAKKLALMRKAT